MTFFQIYNKRTVINLHIPITQLKKKKSTFPQSCFIFTRFLSNPYDFKEILLISPVLYMYY